MRYHHLRFDIWFCLLLSFLLSMGTVKIVELFLPDAYESYVEEHTVLDGDIGGKAGEDVFRVTSVKDVLEHDTFTIISPGIEYRNRGAGYFDGKYMYAVKLPSGERVAALINMESVQNTGESIYSGDSILPVGKVIYQDLTTSENFLMQIEHSEPLDRKDFYIDMIGNGGKLSKEDYTSVPKLTIQIATIIISFPIFHMIGSKIGIFPYFFAPRHKKKSEWE